MTQQVVRTYEISQCCMDIANGGVNPDMSLCKQLLVTSEI